MIAVATLLYDKIARYYRMIKSFMCHCTNRGHQKRYSSTISYVITTDIFPHIDVTVCMYEFSNFDVCFN